MFDKYFIYLSTLQIKMDAVYKNANDGAEVAERGGKGASRAQIAANIANVEFRA